MLIAVTIVSIPLDAKVAVAVLYGFIHVGTLSIVPPFCALSHDSCHYSLNINTTISIPLDAKVAVCGYAQHCSTIVTPKYHMVCFDNS